MSDNNKMEMDQSQAQAQQQNQNQQSQQMIITTHEIQQNVQQQQAQQQQQNQAQQQNQQQQANGSQKIQTQVQVQPQVAAIMPQQHDAVAVSMQHQQQQSQNVGGVSMTLSGQQGATTITTMAAHPQAVQVIQQPMQNQYHLQHALYNAQGTPLLMPGNLLAHPAGINSSPIQVQFNNIAGKPLQAGALQTPHMLTTTSAGQGGAHPGAAGAKVQGFPAGYIPVPTSATPGAGQTLVFSQLEVLPQHQASIQQQQQQQGNNKNDQVQKYTTCATGAPSGQNRGMQFAPWQFATQGIWATGLQPQALLTAAPNQIFFRDPSQPDMLFQSPQPIQTHNAIAAQQQIQGVQQIATTGGKPRVMNIQQQQPTTKQGVVSQRPLSILPSNVQGVQAANIRPASSVSTQTNHGVQTTVNAQTGKAGGGAGKGRGKPVVRTSPGPNTITVTKAGGATTTAAVVAGAASNVQQNAKNVAAVQHNATMIMQTATTPTQAVVATNGNGGAGANGKMLIATTGTGTSAQPPGSPMAVTHIGDKPNFGQPQNKQNVMQSTQQQQQQQAAQAVAQQQAQAQAQAQAVAAAQVTQATATATQVQLQTQQQQQLQQIFIQQFQHQQQQLQQQYQQAQQGGPQQIQPKPIMGMTVQQQPVTQPNMVLGPAGERPMMPVVSINPALIGNQLVSAGPHQLQALPIVSQPGDLQAAAAAAQQQMQQAAAVAAAQQQHLQQQAAQQQAAAEQAPSMPLLMASPEKAQIEIQTGVMPPPPPATPMSVDEKSDKTSNLKKDGAEENGDTTNANDQNTKGDNNETAKHDDKISSNPLINLANAVNSITNGNMEETSVLEPLPTTVNKQVPCKAIVKPQVLTHVIEGFVIQESSEPFPVNRASLNGSMNQDSLRNNSADKENYEEIPNKRRKLSNNYSLDDNLHNGKCEACGIALDEQNMKLKKDKRFCSTICSKSKKKEIRDGSEKQWTDMDVDGKNDIDAFKKNGDDKSLCNNINNVSLDDSPKINPVKWTVNEVCDFIRNLPDCADYAEDFAIQEIDGQALMLLKESHLMSAMSIKLGPALKIVAKINSMRAELAASGNPIVESN